MRIFYEKENENADFYYKIWCIGNKQGYILNLFRGNEPRLNVIHKVNCSRLDVRGKRTAIQKVCSNDLEQLIRYADEQLGKNQWTYCSSASCFGQAVFIPQKAN